MTTAELLTFPSSAKYRRGAVPDLPGLLFDALLRTADAAGVDAARTISYAGGADWLLLYGPGGPDRVEPMRRQLSAGGRVICWDAPYWHRGARLRVSIDRAHPQAWVMRRDWPTGRLEADGVGVADLWRPDGPIILAGIGTKARVQYGADRVDAWEADVVAQCHARWPDRAVYYRPKPHSQTQAPAGAVRQPARLPQALPIDAALHGAGLVLTWHSNVAVDAIRLGIPAVCRDGAAAAVCPSAVPARPEPLAPDLRARFLANLAWFQWAPDEAAQAWAFLKTLLLDERGGR